MQGKLVQPNATSVSDFPVPLVREGNAPDSQKRRVLVITGPTAVGKTAMSVLAAKLLDGEVVSADSVQVYKGLNVGSAKVTAEEMQGVKHHMIDIADPCECLNAAEFATQARKHIDDILSRGKTPIIAGGSGMYLTFLMYGIPETGPGHVPQPSSCGKEDKPGRSESTSDLSRRRQEQSAVGGALSGEQGGNVSEHIPEYRKRRREEIERITGEKIKPYIGLDPQRHNAILDYDFFCIVLSMNRIDLFRRIDLRCEKMIESGLIEECLLLRVKGQLPDRSMGLRAIGYRQTVEYLTLLGQKFLPEFRDGESKQRDKLFSVRLAAESQIYTEKLQNASRKLSTRQMNWFRSDDRFNWYDSQRAVETGDVQTAGEALVGAFRNNEIGIFSSKEGLSKADKNLLKRYRIQNQIFISKESFLDLGMRTLQCMHDAGWDHEKHGMPDVLPPPRDW